MTARDFVASARVALEYSEGVSSPEHHERQRDRATLAALRFQFGHVEELAPLLATLAIESCDESERARWLRLADRVLAG